jgi:hypothetical protein
LRPVLLQNSKAYLFMFSQANFDIIFKFSTTPGTTWCYKPEYSPYVFYRIVTKSTLVYGVVIPVMLLHGLTFA